MTPEALADYLLGEAPPFDSAALSRLEARAGAALPADYRAFLSQHRNGGMTSPTAIEQPPLEAGTGSNNSTPSPGFALIGTARDCTITLS